MRNIKKIMFILTIFVGVFMVSCGDQSQGTNSSSTTTGSSTVVTPNEEDERVVIYNLAVKSGYTGTYEEWLESIKGDSIKLQVSNGYIQWKYSKDATWTNLVKLEDLMGKDGAAGTPGIDGDSTELRVNNGKIQWKYTKEDDTKWRDLLEMSTLVGAKGDSGKEVTFTVADGYIKWQYVGDTTWTNLVELNTLVGPKGESGKEVAFRVEENVLEWQYVGETTWNNLFDLSQLTPSATEEKVIVTFDSNGGSAVDPQEVKAGYNVIKPEDPTKVGYDFAGWYVEEGKWVFAGYSVSYDVTLTAKWEAITYNINLFVKDKLYDNSTYTIEDIDDLPSTNIPLPTEINVDPGYRLNGWLDKDNNPVTSIDVSQLKDFNLYADIEAIDYNISFQDSLGQEVGTQTLNYGDTINYPEIDYNKDSYYLVWYFENEEFDEETFELTDEKIVLKYELKNKYDMAGLDIAINYQGQSGITYREGTTFTNTIENKNYVAGDLLPVWKEFSSILKTEIREASAYSQSNDNSYFTAMRANGFVSETDSNQNVDLMYTTTNYINSAGGSEPTQAVNLLDYIEYMPNFAAFLEENPTIKASITHTNGGIYYTPYFDGYNTPERMFIIDTAVTKAVLDAESFANFDTTISGTGAVANTLQAAKYTPFMDVDYNYPDAETTVTISKNAKISEITIKRTTNIIKQQNELLANGTTGKALAEQFRAYLDVAFAGLIGEGKTFENYSDIFVSESAAYNADELIALMRVVKANPGVISGDTTLEVQPLFARGLANNRVDNIADFMQIWGVQGMTSDKDMLYFDANGKINDAASTKQTYDALKLLSAIYDEGLIADSFWDKGLGNSATIFVNRYFGKRDALAYGLLTYDYPSTPTSCNSIDEKGTGTSDSSRVDDLSNKTITSIMPILPPLSYWGITKDFSVDQDLMNKTGKVLIRYSEDNNSLKINSWFIPSTSDNKIKAVQLMDFMFTEEGSNILNFGPKTYWQAELGTYAGQPTPLMNDKMKTMIASSGTDFWSFMRKYIGATHAVGHVRSAGIKYQAINSYGQVGLANLENAIYSGAVVQGMVDKYDTYTWDTTVPTVGYDSVDDTTAQSYEAVTSFWSSDKCATTAIGWVAVVVSPAGTFTATTENVIGVTTSSKLAYSYKDVMNQIEARRNIYLYTTVNGLDPNLVPDYAKSN